MKTGTTTRIGTPSDIALTAFRMEKPEGWQELVMSATTTAGGKALRKGAGCILWNPANVSALRSGLRHVDGVHVVRQWFGPSANALALMPKRAYFEGDSDAPSAKPERLLVGEARVPVDSPAKRIARCLEFARWLHKRIPGLAESPLAIARVRTRLHESTRMVFAGGASGTAGEKVSNLLMRHGAHTVPEGMRVELVAEQVQHPKVGQYRQLLADAFSRGKCRVSMTVVSYAELADRLAAGGQNVESMKRGYCALVAVTGRKGQPLTEPASRLMDAVQANSVPFRLFSLDNPALRWSALDQVGSLLMGAGGAPYILQLPWPDGVVSPYILGVDLGHPKARRASWVVMSLCDSRGVLVESWRRRQELNETIGPAVLRAGLNWAKEVASVHNDGKQPDFLVIRDGRLHKGETVAAYRRVLGSRVTFLELAKYENPEMFVPGQTPRPVQAGTECLPEGAVTPLIVPVAPRLAADLARTLKLHMPPDWDGLGIGLDRISEIVIGLAYAPGLGLATHSLPGPIYWADGIAAIGERNHQFAGQKVSDGCRIDRGVQC